MITQAVLKEHLKYNELTGFFTRMKSISNRVKIGDTAGYTNPSGYVVIRVMSKNYNAHRLAWLYTHGKWPVCEIDHIDRVKNNNRISNLRECDKFQNQCNTLARKRAKYKSKGVDFMKSKGKFRARISVRGENIHLGLYDTEIEASKSYQEASLKYQEGFGTTRSSANKDMIK